MSAQSSIEWTDRTWNCVVGCQRVSPGCGGAAGQGGCYAERMAYRLEKMGQERYVGLTKKTERGHIRWTGIARFVPSALAEPLTWRKPQRIFVNSMSDLFHEDITNEQIAAVWAVMILGHWHTYQVLTKRADRMLAVLTDPSFYALVLKAADKIRTDRPQLTQVGISDPAKYPARNIWIGVSAEDQQRADERIPLLLKCPAAVRFVSAEPLLGPLRLTKYLDYCERLDKHGIARSCGKHIKCGKFCGIAWVIAGGESGPGARLCNVEWIRSIVEQCREAATLAFVKQLGAQPHDRNDKGGNMAEWPADLRVRMMPGDTWPSAEAAR